MSCVWSLFTGRGVFVPWLHLQMASLSPASSLHQSPQVTLSPVGQRGSQHFPLTGESGLSAVDVDADGPADFLGSPSNHDAAIDQYQDADDEAAPGDLKGFRKRWSKRRKVTEETEYSPSLLQEQFPPEPPVERLMKVSSKNDDSASFVNAFVDRITPSTIVMPWENAFMAPIFGSQFCETKLSMPAQWSETFADPLKHAMPEAYTRCSSAS